ncbi:MAG: isochorismate synthase [Actinomycetota bacterium]|nr:isochorismate synthase [Actinomycetota bacterium]
MTMRAVGYELALDELQRLRALAFRDGTVLERDGLAVYAFDQALRLRLPAGLADTGRVGALEAVLSSIEQEHLFYPPLAVGALPFRPDEPGALVVPELAVVAPSGGQPLAIVTGQSPARDTLERLLAQSSKAACSPAAPPSSGARHEAAPPDRFQLRSRRSHADFLQRVSTAIDEVRTGRLDKVVLAREVVVHANRQLRQHDLLERLRALHPSCQSFAVEGFLGASPELLVSRRGDIVASHPLAGTAPRSGDPEADKRLAAALLASDKERAEHRTVVDAIAHGLSPVCDSLVVPSEPSIVELRNVSHLGTRIEGRLDTTKPGCLSLLARIHPTPAVAGSPTDVALEYLSKVEELERGRYAGAVGWVNAAGDGEWYLGIRSAIVEGRTARLFAGVGIVADSDPETELRETQLKLQAVLAAAVRP